MQNQPNPGGAQPEVQAGGIPAQVAAQKPTNTYGLKSLLAAAASLIITAITAFAFEKVYFYFALLGVYGVYAGIRGIISGARLKGQGVILSVIGLILSLIAIVFTVWLLVP
jgi:hypothetical protein